jgi:hypothetical protein
MTNTSNTQASPGTSSTSSTGASGTAPLSHYKVGDWIQGGYKFWNWFGEIIEVDIPNWNYLIKDGSSTTWFEIGIVDSYSTLVASSSPPLGKPSTNTLSGPTTRTATESRSLADKYWDAIDPWSGWHAPAKCECGADATYGENASAEFHSPWCPKNPQEPV